MSYQPLLPKVFSGPGDHERLPRLASPMSARGSKAASFLLAELDRSIPCSDAELPADAVAMGRQVVYRIDSAPGDECGLLVYPDEYAPNCGHVLITSPLGAALFGLRVGSSMSYLSASNTIREVTVVRVEIPDRSNVLQFRAKARLPTAPTSALGGPDDAA